MPRFAHVRGSSVLDPRTAASVDAYRALWSAEQLAEWSTDTFKEITPGTEHGAVDNGDGTFTNSPPLIVPVVLSKTVFMDLCESAFGGGATGRARFGKIIRACRNSVDDEVAFVYEKLYGSQTFDKTKVTGFMNLLINKGAALVVPAVSTVERDALINVWPNG